MHKYDFGYCLESNPTNKWAFDQIKENTRVLELGPAFGALTKHLREEKNCVVDIVEYDSKAGAHAGVFANKAVVGNAGNLDEAAWYEQLSDERYDYIIALDVLEHLKDPLAVMKKAKTLLKDDGQVIISVPNLAHNAVLARLINNHFGYTNVGLLDNSHVHFFAYHELMELLRDAEMNVESIDGILKPLDGSEIPVSWEDLSPLQANVLRERVYGDVYQYLLVCSPKKMNSPEVICRNLLGDGRIEGKSPRVFIVINGQADRPIECTLKDHAVDCEIDCMQRGSIDELRIVVTQESMLLSDIKVYVKSGDESFPQQFNWTSGTALSKEDVLFSGTQQCEINYVVAQKAERIQICFTHTWIDQNITALLERNLVTLVERNNRVVELEESLKIIQAENQMAWAQFAQRDAERNEELGRRLGLEEANRQKVAENEELRRQLEASNTDRTVAWEQFSQRDAERNEELAKRLELEEIIRGMTAGSEEIRRQLEASNAERTMAWEQFSQRDAERNEELAKRLELEETIRRMTAESEELRRQLEASNADRAMAWERFAERDQQLLEANQNGEQMRLEIEDLQFAYQREKQRARQMLTKIEKLEASAIIRYYEKVKKI